jgi:hypothetical protein
MVYEDPSNIDEIHTRIKNAPTMGDVVKIVDEVFPGWLVAGVKSYSDDYPALTKRWEENARSKFNVKPACVLLVDKLIVVGNRDSHTLIHMFAELFFRSGFSVHRKEEFVCCRICSKAIPCKQFYNLMVTNKEYIPSKWSDTCTSCKIEEEEEPASEDN